MNAILRSLSLIVVSALAFSAQAGTASSGGGNAVVCRDQATNTIASAEMLDLYEARMIRNLKLISASGKIDQDFDSAQWNARFRHGVSEWKGQYLPPTPQTANFIEYTLNNYIRLTNIKLPTIRDTGNIPPLSANCKVEQVAIHNLGDDFIWVQKEIWDSFNSLNKAALIMHENEYATRRTLGDVSSEPTRFDVGYWFAEPANWLFDVPRNATLYSCYSKRGTSIQFALDPTHDQIVLALNSIHGRALANPIEIRFSADSSNETNFFLKSGQVPTLNAPLLKKMVNVNFQKTSYSSSEGVLSFSHNQPIQYRWLDTTHNIDVNEYFSTCYSKVL